MRYIDTWLKGLGLDYVIPKLDAVGITTPKKLASLTLRDIYEVVGVENSEDRKKLFFLIQRLQTILQSKSSDGRSSKKTDESDSENEEEENEDPVVPVAAVGPSSSSAANRRVEAEEAKGRGSSRSRRLSTPAAPAGKNSLAPATNPTAAEGSKTTLRNQSATSNHSESVKRVEAVLQEKRFEDPSDAQKRMHKSSGPLLISPKTPQRPTVSPISRINTEVAHDTPPPPPPTRLQHSSSRYDMPIRVVVRKRPLSRTETNRNDRDILEIRSNGMVLVHEPKVKVDLTKVTETQTFVFDDAFDHMENNALIYSRTVRPLVSFMFEGGKASCFAYGQTGSGKTFSMMGANPQHPTTGDTSNMGLYALAGRDIFSHIAHNRQFAKAFVGVSCFEIYGGKLFDLLNNRSQIKCLEDAKQQVRLPGLTTHPAASLEELMGLMAKAHSHRSVGSTGANAESSRSHQVLQIVVREAKSGSLGKKGAPAAAPPMWSEGKLSFIDLAGSERGADTHASSKQTRMEGAEINTSLLALKEVIRSLEKKHGHTPFRGSKLTQVLKDSFVGEKSRTCMIACISPAHSNCEHTLNTLRYADRVKEHSASTRPETAAADSPTAAEADYSSDLGDRDFEEKEDISANISPPQPVVDRNLSGGLRKHQSAPQMSPSSSPSSSQLSALFPTKAKPLPSPRSFSSQGFSAKPSPPPSKNYTVHRHPPSPAPPPPAPLIDDDISAKLGNLIAAHRLSVAELVEVMKDEMELVQNMENVDERRTKFYLDRLDQLLDMKSLAITSLRYELDSFQRYRDVPWSESIVYDPGFKLRLGRR